MKEKLREMKKNVALFLGRHLITKHNKKDDGSNYHLLGYHSQNVSGHINDLLTCIVTRDFTAKWSQAVHAQ